MLMGLFHAGKYSDGSSPADEWFKQGKIVSVKEFVWFLSIETLVGC